MATSIALSELQRLITDGAQLVEVLPAQEYAQAHLPAAINIPPKRLTAQTAGVLDRERAVVVYCWDSL
jgi:rhodanese-related sulfurtransferase